MPIREKQGEYARRWRENNSARNVQVQKDYRFRARTRALEHYGAKCACCGEQNRTFLAFDHVNNDGYEHRRTEKIVSSHQLVAWIIRNDFPENIQVLCHNCNFGKRLNDGICPHQCTATAVARAED